MLIDRLSSLINADPLSVTNPSDEKQHTVLCYKP